MEDYRYFVPLSLEGTFGRVIHIFLKRWKAFLVISSLVYLAGLLFAMLTALLMGNDLKIDGFSIQPQSNNPRYFIDSTLFCIIFRISGDNLSDSCSFAGFEHWSLVVYTLEALIYYCFSCVAHGATIWLATHLYLEQYPSILDGFWNAGTKVLALVCSLVLIALIGVTTFLLFFPVPVCYFFIIVFYHVYPSIMVENAGTLHALSRSWEISNGQRCFIFNILFGCVCFRAAVGFLISKLAQRGSVTEVNFNEEYMEYEFYVKSYSWQYYVAQALDIGFGILFLSLESVFQTVLYLRNRAANESLDKVGLASELGSTEDGDYITMTNNNNNNNNAPSNEKAGDETRSEDPKTFV